MNTRKVGFSALLASAVLLASAPPTRADSRDANERAARKACLSGNVQKGVEILSDLFIKTEDPTYIYNQGRCFEQNGRCEEAINRFREYLRKATNISADIKADTEKHIADCHALLGSKPAPEVIAKPEPAPVPKPEPVREALARKAEAPAAPLAVPATPAALPTTLAVPVAPNHLVANQTEPASRPGRSLRIGGIACGIAGVGSIATAIYFYTKARSYSDKVSSQDVVDPSDDSAGKNAETMQWVFYGVGGAALATGVVLYALGGRADNDRAAAIAPLVGNGVAGISAQGAF